VARVGRKCKRQGLDVNDFSVLFSGLNFGDGTENGGAEPPKFRVGEGAAPRGDRKIKTMGSIFEKGGRPKINRSGSKNKQVGFKKLNRSSSKIKKLKNNYMEIVIEIENRPAPKKKSAGPRKKKSWSPVKKKSGRKNKKM